MRGRCDSKTTLSPGATLPAFTATGLDWVGLRKDGWASTCQLPFRWDSGEERTYGAMQQPPIVSAGTPVVLRNAGDTALVFYRLTTAI